MEEEFEEQEEDIWIIIFSSAPSFKKIDETRNSLLDGKNIMI